MKGFPPITVLIRLCPGYRKGQRYFTEIDPKPGREDPRRRGPRGDGASGGEHDHSVGGPAADGGRTGGDRRDAPKNKTIPPKRMHRAGLLHRLRPVLRPGNPEAPDRPGREASSPERREKGARERPPRVGKASSGSRPDPRAANSSPLYLGWTSNRAV